MDLISRTWASTRARWRLLGAYERFEEVILLLLTLVIAVVVVAAIWNVILEVIASLVLTDRLAITEHAAFQRVFGMIFTVIIALEFKRSLLISVERRESIFQARTLVLLALLAILRKFIILDLETAEPGKLLALSAAILALGGVFWALRQQDRALHERASRLEG